MQPLTFTYVFLVTALAFADMDGSITLGTGIFLVLAAINEGLRVAFASSDAEPTQTPEGPPL